MYADQMRFTRARPNSARDEASITGLVAPTRIEAKVHPAISIYSYRNGLGSFSDDDGLQVFAGLSGRPPELVGAARTWIAGSVGTASARVGLHLKRPQSGMIKLRLCAEAALAEPVDMASLSSLALLTYHFTLRSRARLVLYYDLCPELARRPRGFNLSLRDQSTGRDVLVDSSEDPLGKALETGCYEMTASLRDDALFRQPGAFVYERAATLRFALHEAHLVSPMMRSWRQLGMPSQGASAHFARPPAQAGFLTPPSSHAMQP